MLRSLRGTVALGALLLTGCARAPEQPPPEVKRELPSTQILRVAEHWQAMLKEKGFRSEPSPVNVFEVHFQSTLDLQHGAPHVREELEVLEDFQLRDGRRFHCESRTSLSLQARYSRRHGEPAVELIRPASRLARRCVPPSYPDPVLELPRQAGRFVLADDELRAFAPALEKRVYLPID
jgi:hypothetical protein